MKVKYSSRIFGGVITSLYPSSLIDEGGISSIKVESLRKGGN
jgi:hypothetical protein